MSEQPDQRTTTAATRTRLFEAATEELIEVDPASASMAAIARRAGVPLSTLQDFFPSHMELMAELCWHLYVEAFRRLPGRQDGHPDLGAFLMAYIRANRRPEVRLVWQLGELVRSEHPDNIDAAFWHLVSEIEKRLAGYGMELDLAHERALVLAPALMLISRRTAQELATVEEAERFTAAALNLVLAGIPTTDRGAAPAQG